jgi:3'(2'), 5'-bisphosphate nucleotidase
LISKNVNDVLMLDLLEELCAAAGQAILDVYAAGEGASEVSWKGDGSPLTRADAVSHAIIMEALELRFPGMPVVSEESGEANDAPPQGRGDWWLVDPLDGTKEFIRRTGEFTVNVALVRDGRPIVGAVHAPALGRTWLAAGGTAWVQGAEGRQRIRVGGSETGRTRIAVSRDHAGADAQRMLDRYRGAEVVRMGSSLKFCLIAEGRADLYFRDGPTMEWDTAAAQVVLEGAGGRVQDLAGEPLTYGKAGLINPAFVAVGAMPLVGFPLGQSA